MFLGESIAGGGMCEDEGIFIGEGFCLEFWIWGLSGAWFVPFWTVLGINGGDSK